MDYPRHKYARWYGFQVTYGKPLDGEAGDLARACEIERLREWMGPLAAIPSITVGLKLEGYPHVVPTVKRGSVPIHVVREIETVARRHAAMGGDIAASWGAELPEHYEVLRQLLSMALRALQLRETASRVSTHG